MEIVTTLCRALAERVGQERYDLWFGEGVCFSLDGGCVRVATDTPFKGDRLRKGFLGDIQAVACEVLEQAGSLSHDSAAPVVEFVVVPEPEPDVTGEQSAALVASCSGRDAVALLSADNRPAAPIKAGSARHRGRRFQTLKTFVTGECNQLARTSANLVMQQLGEISPLVVHGGTGVGKSHLLEGIWCQLRRTELNRRVVFLSAEQFTTFFLAALKGTGLPSFRRKCRDADVLIIDDAQFLAGKQATIVELLHTIDDLLRGGRQIIMAADRPPSQLKELGAELTARLSGGLVCGMQPLDQKTREDLLRQWAQQRQVCLSPAVMRAVAEHVGGDARQLSGVLNRLRAISEATGEPVTSQVVRDVLCELYPQTPRMIRLPDVERAVCQVFGLAPHSLQTGGRARSISHPRMLAMWLARKHTRAGLVEISEFFGRRSHSTVVSANHTVDGWIDTSASLCFHHQDRNIHEIVGELESQLKAG